MKAAHAADDRHGGGAAAARASRPPAFGRARDLGAADAGAAAAPGRETAGAGRALIAPRAVCVVGADAGSGRWRLLTETPIERGEILAGPEAFGRSL